MHRSDEIHIAQGIASAPDPVELTPVHVSLLLKAIYRKLETIEQKLEAE